MDTLVKDKVKLKNLQIQTYSKDLHYKDFKPLKNDMEEDIRKIERSPTLLEP